MTWRIRLLGFIAAFGAGVAPAGTIAPATTGFGANGVATVSDGSSSVYANALAVAADGSLLVASSGQEADAYLLRLSPDGRQIDFGANHHPVMFGTGVECSPGLALRRDDGMVMACGSVVASVRPDGFVRWATTVAGANFDAVAVDGLGRTVAAGNVLVRVRTDGSIDTTFPAVTQPSPAAAVVADGRRVLVVAGGSVVAYQENGTLDASFGQGGVASFPGFDAEAFDLSKSWIVAGGSRGSQAAVVRFTGGGSVDTTFGAGGIAAWGPGRVSTLAVNALATRANGAIDAAVIGAGPESYLPPEKWLVQRLTPAGALGTTAEGPNDFLVPPDGGCFQVLPTAITEQPNGMVAVAGLACQDNIDGDFESLVMRSTSRLRPDVGEALRVSPTGRPTVRADRVAFPVFVNGPCRLIARVRQLQGGTPVGRVVSASTMDVAGGRVLIRLHLSPSQLRRHVAYVVGVGAYDAQDRSVHILVPLKR